jgi:hypothetical protein
MDSATASQLALYYSKMSFEMLSRGNFGTKRSNLVDRSSLSRQSDSLQPQASRDAAVGSVAEQAELPTQQEDVSNILANISPGFAEFGTEPGTSASALVNPTIDPLLPFAAPMNDDWETPWCDRSFSAPPAPEISSFEEILDFGCKCWCSLLLTALSYS